MNQPKDLWRRVVSGIHNLTRKPVDSLAKKAIRGSWSDIAKLPSDLEKIGIPLEEVVEFCTGASSNTLFWYDKWSEHGVLAENFPLLFALDKRKKSFVSERLVAGSPSWDWKRAKLDTEESRELESLNQLILGLTITNSQDPWRSRMAKNDEFQVCDLSRAINSKITRMEQNPTTWIPLMPIKVTCLIWRACWERIPTLAALNRRGMNFSSPECYSCDSGTDDTNHALITCPFIKETLDWVWRWCNILDPSIGSVNDLISFAVHWGRCPKKRKIFIAIIYGFIWCGWKARNDRAFNKVRISPMVLADNILTEVFGWVKFRGNYKNCNWVSWCCNPFNIM